MVKIAANEPLWYGKGRETEGEENPFVYEESDWHKKHLRFSDEVKTSDGETTTLQDGSNSSPDGGKKVSDPSGSDTAHSSNEDAGPADLEGGLSRDQMVVSPNSSDAVSPMAPSVDDAMLASPDEAGGFHQGYMSGFSEATTPADDEAAPSPNISRTSVDINGRRLRSAGRA